MTDREMVIARAAFRAKYFDLGIYRWMVRNKHLVLPFLGIWFFWSIVLCFLGRYLLIQVWFWFSFPLVVLGGIDHMIIGFRLRLILRILEDVYRIEIPQEELIETCRDLIKQ